MLWLLLFASFTASAQCCYNPEPIDLFETPHKKYNFEFEFKEPNNDFKLFVLLNVLDGYTTYRGLQNPNVTELNPIIGNNPSAAKLVAVKTFGTWYTYKHVPESDLKILNKILLVIVMNNLDVLDEVGEISY